MNSEASTDPPSGDIAVIGLACRFPGGASNEAKFWDLLHGKKCDYAVTLKAEEKLTSL